MDEKELKVAVASALEASLDDCEVYVKPRGVLLVFMEGQRWLLQPLDVGEEPHYGDDEDDDDYEEDED